MEFDCLLESLFHKSLCLSPYSSSMLSTIAVSTTKGMSLMEDKGQVYVKKIESSSVLGRDGRIRAGDRVLSINGKSLEGMAFSKVKYVDK